VTAPPRPGLSRTRLARLVRDAVDRCRLDLSGRVVLTEAATGAYVVTPVLAALAGARVYAVTCATVYGSVEDVARETGDLADLLGVRERIDIVTEKSREVVARADIVTNSGHVRPIDRTMIGWMKPTAVIPLMYEAWEFRPDDVDIAACRRHGIRVAGTDERAPDADVFSFLGILAVKLLLDAGIPVHGSRLLVLCDNPFAPFLARGLAGAGAAVDVGAGLAMVSPEASYDALLVALRPGRRPVLSATDVAVVARRWPGAVVAQFWGDLDRPVLAAHDVPVWPPAAPAPGHMGILLSAVGPDPIVRLQAAGLKVGELLSRASASERPALDPNQLLCGQGAYDI
jgi:hypothetical protein